ncbi:MAG: hypothetical protein KC619_00475 [Myxococcales bacterium]|nr:hypothetical protein [Myxococcales bacterium]
MSGASTEGWQLVFDDPEIAIASWGDLLVMLFRVEVSLHSLELVERAEADLLRSHASIRSLTVFPNIPARPTDAEVRARSQQLADRFGPRVEGAAVVIEATGFTAAMIRSLVLGIRMISPLRGLRISLFDDVGAALDWLHSKGGATDVSQIREALRTHLDALR